MYKVKVKPPCRWLKLSVALISRSLGLERAIVHGLLPRARSSGFELQSLSWKKRHVDEPFYWTSSNDIQLITV